MGPGPGFAIALVLASIGLELSTRTLSASWVRMRESLAALRDAGATQLVPTWQFFLGLFLVAAAFFTAFLVTWRWTARRRIAAVAPGCPECGNSTRRIRRRLVHRLAGPLLGEDLTRRRCSQCGWVGLAKDT